MIITTFLVQIVVELSCRTFEIYLPTDMPNLMTAFCVLSRLYDYKAYEKYAGDIYQVLYGKF